MQKLIGADLKYANLTEADLSEAKLRHADLRDADLSSANLRGANLMYANLYRAILEYADLRGADLDFSCLPLSCGGLNLIVDNRLQRQFLYHAYKQSNLEQAEDLKELFASELFQKCISKFHKFEECEEKNNEGGK